MDSHARTTDGNPEKAGIALPSETSLRAEIAIATRLLNSLKILEYSGHVSALLPGNETLLVQPQEKSRAEVSPEDLLVCDMDGKVVAG
ncbi:class II aldolase/adducin family protein, partial [Phyllobacterium sp. P5_D12]